MRVEIDEDTVQLINGLLRECEQCKYFGTCGSTYLNRREIIKAAILKFSSLGCTYPEEAEKE